MSNFGYNMPSYFQNMPQLGKPLTGKKEENENEIKAIEINIAEKIKMSTEAGRSDESLNSAGQLTPTQRLERLVDKGSWCPLNSIYNPYENPNGSTSVITGLGKIHDKWSVVVVSDHKKLAGAWVAGQAYKITRACDIAIRLRIPLVYVLNCSGVKLDEWDRIALGRITGGTPFYRHAELAQKGIPVLVGIFGTNPAGGGYHSISPTVLIAHEKANMAVGGAGIVGGMNPKGFVDKEAAQALIDTTKSAKKMTPPGAVTTHYNETGFFREIYGTEDGVLDALKKYVDSSAAYNENYFRVAPPAEPALSSEELYSILPVNQKRIYDIKDVLGRIVDNSEFMEYKKNYGPEIVCGLAKMNGLLVGIISNYQGFIPNYPEYRENSAGMGGKLYRQGLIKMNEFVTLCSRDRIPLLWMQDTTGIDVGDLAERAELLGLGQSLVYSIQNAKVPQMEITLRKANGASHYVMGGPVGTESNVFCIGTAVTEMLLMNSETAAAAMYARRLVKEQEAGRDIQPVIDKMNNVIKDYQEKSKPHNCAQMGWLDEIVDLNAIRRYVCAFVGAAYQNPAGVCPFHQMLTPRVSRDWDNLNV